MEIQQINDTKKGYFEADKGAEKAISYKNWFD